MTPSEKRAMFGRQQPTNPGSPATEVSGDTKMAETKASLTTAAGRTRGKNPRDISYQKLDRDNPETLPKSLAEFLEITKTANDDKPYSQDELLSFAIDGFNLAQYSAASDEIGEFIPDGWDKDTSNQFRLAVRNTSKLAGLSIEDTVAMLKPAVEKGIAAKAAAKVAADAAKASETVTA